MLRAIYTGDVRYTECPVFEYRENMKQFVMLEDEEEKSDIVASYDFMIVMNDPHWIVFAVSGEDVVRLDTPHRLTDEEIAINLKLGDD